MTAQVTVVVPTRDRRDLLARTLRTILGQRDVSLEVVVVDDGSSDGTARLARGMSDVVRVVRNDVPRGVAAARNQGLRDASTEWVAFCDDDDLWAPTKISRQLAAMAERPGAQWSCTGSVLVDDRLRFLRPELAPPAGDVAALLLAENRIPAGGSGVVAATDLARTVGAFNTGLKVLADWDLWIRLAIAAPLAPVNRPLTAYVIHGRAMTRSAADALTELEDILNRYKEERESRGVRAMRDQWWGWMARLHLIAGDRRTAARLHRQIFREYRHWSWLPFVAMGLAVPATVRLVDRWERHRRTPAGWWAEASGWLAEVEAP